MPEAILVKLGGSLITDKARPETPRLPVIRRLAEEIARAAAGSGSSGVSGAHLIVGHGSGSFGHVAAARYGIASGLSAADQLPGISLTQERAAALHWQVMAELLAAGALPFSLAPSSALVTVAGEPVAFGDEPLLLALERGLLPVLYGDVVLDRGQGVAICSTERLFTLLARRLPERGIAVRRALWLGETAGVWDEEGRTIPHLTRADVAAMAGMTGGTIGAAAGTDVTGGMRHRVETALALADLGITSQILDGREPGLLERALAGEAVPGTVIGPG
ncbi:MAG TPA: isopentenyl phosphate kinase [Thermoanaerobaculia bacterium]|jgi:isopentenyl phosphate kinase|nr:isopentenyl phosphate kinase [Thermoanaerobaculia bacterium]